MRSRRWALLLVAYWGIALLASWTGVTFALDAGYEYVQEVIEEEQQHYGDTYDRDNPYMDESAYQAKQEEQRRLAEEQERRRLEEEERMAHEANERVRQQREAAFEKELSQMSAEKAKAARKQKKKDARIVKRILGAAKLENHYAVLGIRNWEVIVPPRSLGFGKFTLRIPGFSMFYLSEKAIRKAYRKASREVHPDRNRDGRAELAFIALENSAAILSDTKQREAYDEQVRALKRQRRQHARRAAAKATDGVLRITHKVVNTFRKVLGPFAFPATVLGALLV